MVGAVDAAAAGDEMDGGGYRADGELEALLATLASETADGMDAPPATSPAKSPAPMPAPMVAPMVAPMAEPAAAASLEEVCGRHLFKRPPPPHISLYLPISPYISHLLKRPPISRHLPERTLTLSLVPALTPKPIPIP